MRVHDLGSDPLRSNGGARAPGTAGQPDRRAAAQAGRGEPRADRVEISEQARAMAAGSTPASEAPSESLSVERIASIRERIEAGLYNSPEMAEAVARRLLELGDV